ncbi:MAG: serine/threonine-protein kinase [Polyangiaceae bacterium]
MNSAGQLLAGKYRLLRELGRGGMGVVWHARNEAIEREVAIKVLGPQVAGRPGVAERFFQEARICGALRHPGIIDVLDLGHDEDGKPFLVMELLEGEAFDAVLERQPRLTETTALRIVREVALSLVVTHERGIVHRDLKPANIFIHTTGRGAGIVKVLDFGASKMTQVDRRAVETTTGMLIGSPAYMSPEQAGGRLEIDARSDIYSLGAILFEALTGSLPFETAPTVQAMVVDIATRSAPPVAQRAAGLDAAVAAVVDDCLRFDRELRVQSAPDLVARIDGVLRGLSPGNDGTFEVRSVRLAASRSEPRPPRAQEPASKLRRSHWLVLAGLAVTGAALVWLTQRSVSPSAGSSEPGSPSRSGSPATAAANSASSVAPRPRPRRWQLPRRPALQLRSQPSAHLRRPDRRAQPLRQSPV